MVTAELSIKVLEEGIHSGGSGIFPETFRILRMLLNRCVALLIFFSLPDFSGNF
jgi:hypothetical protein